jgi:hypothetical protein
VAPVEVCDLRSDAVLEKFILQTVLAKDSHVLSVPAARFVEDRLLMKTNTTVRSTGSKKLILYYCEKRE